MDDRIEEMFKTRNKGRVYRSVIDDAERILIEKALEKTMGHQVLAAKWLGINRNTLRAKIRRFKIDTKTFRA